jgi:hypothetical protein
MNDILIENIKLKSELQYDILFESTEYHSLDSSTQTFLKECYDMGVNTGIYFHRNEQMLIESMDEGFFDRLKAGAVRAGQGVKNLSGFGSQTADSKDAGVDSLLNNFKQKFEKAKQTQGQGSNPNADALKDKIVDDIEILDKRVVNDPTPAPDPKTAEDIVVKNPGIPKSLKDKIIQGIRENPGKIKFLLAAASFGAGVAAATYSLGNPIAIKAAGAAVNGIGNAILAKIQGRGTGDAIMSGLTQGVAGAALAGAGASTVNAISSYIDQAGEVSPNAFQVTKQKQKVTAPSGPIDRGSVINPNAQSPESLSIPDAPDAPIDRGSAINPNAQSPESLSIPNVQGQNIPATPSATAPKYVEPGTRAARVDFDANQQAQYYKSRGYTGPKDTLGRPKAIFKENKESMFVKSYNNTYTLKKSLNENIEEKWNESVEETLEEALNAAQQKAYDEFLIDLGKMFNKSKDEVIPFMQSQGTRFKNVLDYLNQNVTPTQAPTAPAPEQPVQQPNQVKPSLAKYINGIKGSALFAGDLAARIQKTIDFPVDKDATKNVRSMIELRTFLKSLNGILNTNSANYRKQIGDPSVLLQQVNEDIKEYSSLAKQISDVMPSLVGATFELRQMYGKRQSSAPGGKAPAGAVPPVIKEEDIKLGGSLGQAKSNLSVEELSRAKFFLSKLVDIGLLVKSINVAQADQVQMKNLYKNLLELANLVVNKNVKGIKLNKKIDSAFQGKDILGPNAVDKKQSPVKQGPGDIFKEGKKNNFKLR